VAQQRRILGVFQSSPSETDVVEDATEEAMESRRDGWCCTFASTRSAIAPPPRALVHEGLVEARTGESVCDESRREGDVISFVARFSLSARFDAMIVIRQAFTLELFESCASSRTTGHATYSTGPRVVTVADAVAFNM